MKEPFDDGQMSGSGVIMVLALSVCLVIAVVLVTVGVLIGRAMS